MNKIERMDAARRAIASINAQATALQEQAPVVAMQRAMAELADTVPPVEPPPVKPVDDRPRVHRVSAWRHDGGMSNTNHGSLEAAQQAAGQLSYVIFWKYAVVCLHPYPRVVETRSIQESVS